MEIPVTTSNTNLERFVRPREAARILSVSKAQLWRMRQDGRLPEPYKIGKAGVAWWLPDLVDSVRNADRQVA